MSTQITRVFSSFEFAYVTVYKKAAPGVDNGKLASAPDVAMKTFKDRQFEAVIPDDFLENIFGLTSMNGGDRIRIPSISLGYNRYYLGHVVLFVKGLKQSEATNIVGELNKIRTIKSAWFPFNSTSTYLCLATRNWYRYRNTTENTKILKWITKIPEIARGVLE